MLERVEFVRDVKISINEKPWVNSTEEQKKIDDLWEVEVKKLSQSYNGLLYLTDPATLKLDGSQLSACVRQTDYKSFLYWRYMGCPADKVDIFGSSALVSSDGAVLLGEMASHTSNASKIYFCAGSLDEGDRVGDEIDIRVNIQRELSEETGYQFPLSSFDGEKMIVMAEGFVSVIKVLKLSETAEEIIAKANAFFASEENSELSRLVAIWNEADMPIEKMPRYAVLATQKILSMLN